MQCLGKNWIKGVIRVKSLFEDYVNLVGVVMDLRLKRQNVIAGNLANLENPNYKARRIYFEEKLQDAVGMSDKGELTRTNPKHLPVKFDPNNFTPDFTKEMEIRVVKGEDSVDLDKEMVLQAKNTLNYKVLALILQKSFAGMSDVITSAGGQ